MSKTEAKRILNTTLSDMGPEARAFWSKTTKGPQGQLSPYDVALGAVGKTGDLLTSLVAVWADLGFPR